MMIFGRSPARHLTVVFVGRVVVRGMGLELGGAGVDGLHGGRHARRQSGGPYPTFLDGPQPGQLGVGETEPLDPPPVRPVQLVRARPGRQAGPFRGDEPDLVQEPRIDTCGLVEPFQGDAAALGGFQMEGAVRRGDSRPAHQFVVAPPLVESLGGIAVEAEPPPLERAQPLL